MPFLISPGDRAALLRHGIVVVGAEIPGGRLHVAVTGIGADRVRETVECQLGDVVVDVLGSVPREIRPRPLRGHMEREAGRLQVRLAVRGDEHVDDIVVAEDERSVVVLATVCTAVAGEEGRGCEVPYHVYLEAPLGDRVVIDGSTGDRVPYKNVWDEIEKEFSRRAAPRGARSPRA